MHATQDLYPSRVAERPAIEPRRDPIVHGDAAARAAGPLDEMRLARYERDGFLHFEHLLDADEIAGLVAERDGLWAWARDADADTIIREPKSELPRSIFAIHRDNAVFSRLTSHPKLVGMAEQILGGPVYIHQSRINFKPGFRGKEFYWHSDFETWHIEDGMPRMRAFSISIALSENTPNNGPLMVIPGSHRHYVACVGATPADHYKDSLRTQEYGVPDDDSLAWLVEKGGIAAPVGGPGAAVLFECNTMHGSNGNITPLPRSNVFFVYNAVENALTKPFGVPQPRPDYIASRDFTPVTAAG